MFRKLIAVLIVSCLISTAVFAGNVGNPVVPIKNTTEFLGVGAGFGANRVAKRRNNLDNKRGPRDMKPTDLTQVYGKFIYGVSDNMDVYAKIGNADYDLEFYNVTLAQTMEIEVDPGLYTGMGVKGLYPLFDMGGFSFGWGYDVQGNTYFNDVSAVSVNGTASPAVDGQFYGIDGQNSAYLTCQYDIEMLETSIIPYIGAYHSWMIVGTTQKLQFNAVDGKHYQAAYDFTSFGLLLGVDFDIAKYVSVNVGGRVGGETAVNTGVILKF